MKYINLGLFSLWAMLFASCNYSKPSRAQDKQRGFLLKLKETCERHDTHLELKSHQFHQYLFNLWQSFQPCRLKKFWVMQELFSTYAVIFGGLYFVYRTNHKMHQKCLNPVELGIAWTKYNWWVLELWMHPHSLCIPSQLYTKCLLSLACFYISGVFQSFHHCLPNLFPNLTFFD